MKGKKHNEDGAIVVEASMALPVYMFLIITILTIINICYVQAKVQIALNTSAKQISQSMYIYYASDANELFSGSGGKSSEAMGKISEFMTTLLAKFEIENESLTSFTEALAGTSIAGVLTDAAMEAVLKPVTESVLVLSEGDTADDFYRRMRIVGEPEFEAQFGSEDKYVMLGMSYKIEIVKLFDIDFTIDMYNVVSTTLWGNK